MISLLSILGGKLVSNLSAIQHFIAWFKEIYLDILRMDFLFHQFPKALL